jgi:CspA family cold shock protein
LGLAEGAHFDAPSGGRGALVRLELQEEKIMAEGTIKRITDKGFGFIDMGGGNDMFFHMSSVEGAHFNELHEGQQVSFEVGQGPKGPRAEHVRPL